jgi:hypothetical protein
MVGGARCVRRLLVLVLVAVAVAALTAVSCRWW